MQGNAQHTVVFYDVHRFGRHLAKRINVNLTKCEGDIGEFFLLTTHSFDYEALPGTKGIVTDQVFRNQMEAMINTINLWNKTVMENPITEEEGQDEEPLPFAVPTTDEEDEFPW